MVRIIVLPQKTFRGVLHFEETKYDASSALAEYAVAQGVAKLAPLPVLSEGAKYLIEIMSTEKRVCGTLLKIVDDAPLGRGFSFQMPHGRRVFIYERDLRPGPNGSLIASI